MDTLSKKERWGKSNKLLRASFHGFYKIQILCNCILANLNKVLHIHLTLSYYIYTPIHHWKHLHKLALFICVLVLQNNTNKSDLVIRLNFIWVLSKRNAITYRAIRQRQIHRWYKWVVTANQLQIFSGSAAQVQQCKCPINISCAGRNKLRSLSVWW